MALLPNNAVAQSVPLTQDAYVIPGSGNNYGSAGTLNVGGPSASQALVQFDLTVLPSGTTSAQIAKATLVLFVNKLGAPGPMNVSVANGPWSELTVASAGAPVPAAAVASGVAVSSANSYVYVDATAAVQGWLSGTTNSGFILTPASGPLNVAFDSKESATTSHPALLQISITSAGPTGPTGPQGSVGAQGSTGAQGSPGVTGSTGPSGVIAKTTFRGSVGIITAGAPNNAFSFIGPRAIVTVANTDTILVEASAAVGVGGTGTIEPLVQFDVCYSQSGGPVTAPGSSYLLVPVPIEVKVVTVNNMFSGLTGAVTVGMCASNRTSIVLAGSDFVQGYVLVLK